MNQESRRAFLQCFPAVAGGALVSQVRSTAQNPNPRRIDVHHHFTPPSYLQFLKTHNQGDGGVPGGRGGALNSAYAGWTLSEDLEDMDRSGTATAILSITTPGFSIHQVLGQFFSR